MKPTWTSIWCYTPGEDQCVVINFSTTLTAIYGANCMGKTVRIILIHTRVIQVTDNH